MMHKKLTKNIYIVSLFLFYTILSRGSTLDNYRESLIVNNIIQWPSSQTDTIVPYQSPRDESIVVLAKAYGDSIVLRFAPPDFAFWQRAKNSGFVIRRGLDSLNTKVIATVKPIPLDKIDTSLFAKDSLALMAAGLLYGEFDRSQIQGGINEHRANQQLLNMSLMVSEFSPLASTILGFRYTDTDVEMGKSYFYEISNPVYKAKKYNGSVQIKNEFKSPRAPYQLRIIQGDEEMVLKWSKDYNKSNFTYYKIERSSDNVNFIVLTELPLVFLNSELTNALPEFTYVDSLNLANNQKYYYRVYGGNSFGEYSPPALIEGTPRDLTPPPPPKLTAVTYDDDVNIFSIEWEMDIAEVPDDFGYIQVMSARKESGDYSAISEKLGVGDFQFLYDLGNKISEDQEGRYFFRIDCYDNVGNVSSSNFETSFVPDFTNPATPDSLTGYVDTLSFVHIHWSKSNSKDVRGYWLYWANEPDAELSLVTQDIITDTSYQYYIAEKSLTKKIYYTVRAEDYAYNRSDAADILELKRRDIVPPITPTIQSINTDSLKMKINILESKSEDLKYYELFRRSISDNSADTAWVLLDSLGFGNQYIDDSAALDEDYQYSIRAIDSTGNKSDFSKIKEGRLKADGRSLFIKNLSIKLDKKENSVQLTWNFDLPNSLSDKKYGFIIYRSSGQEGTKFYQDHDSIQTSFSDKNISNGVLYNYAVRVKMEDENTGALSETKSILVK